MTALRRARSEVGFSTTTVLAQRRLVRLLFRPVVVAPCCSRVLLSDARRGCEAILHGPLRDASRSPLL